MKRAWLALLALQLCVAPLHAADADQGAAKGSDKSAATDDEADSNPHHMSGPDDEESCTFCHEEDMSLSASLLDTCLTCHSLTEHSGSIEHVRADVASVARLQPTPVQAGAPSKLPLTEKGEIWCGTCHLFHDPRVNEEALLTEAWVPPDSGLSGTLRTAIAAHWRELAAKYNQPPPVARFATKGSTWLRLPVADGQLCISCHRDTGKKP